MISAPRVAEQLRAVRARTARCWGSATRTSASGPLFELLMVQRRELELGQLTSSLAASKTLSRACH